jgi:hypothetical protein
MQVKRRIRAITPEAQEWVRELSRHTPQALGYAPSTWSVTLLVAHIRGVCRAAGHPCLAGLTYGALTRLLALDSDRETYRA